MLVDVGVPVGRCAGVVVADGVTEVAHAARRKTMSGMMPKR